MANTGQCTSVVDGIGAKQCISGNVIKMLRKGIVTIPGFQFDTYADYADEDKWNEAIAAGNAFVMEDFKDLEDASVEESIVDTASGDKFLTRDGKRGFIGYMDLTLAQNVIFQSYSNTKWNIFIIDDAENIIGTTPDNIIVKGLTVSYFNPKPMILSTGADQISRTPVEIQLQYNNEIDKNPCVLLGDDITWSPIKLEPTTVVTVSDVSIAAFVITASFNVVDNTIQSKPTVPMRTITVTNLIVIDEGGDVVVPSGVVETTTLGTYEITTSAMVSGTIQLTASATSLFYSAQTAVTV